MSGNKNEGKKRNEKQYNYNYQQQQQQRRVPPFQQPPHRDAPRQVVADGVGEREVGGMEVPQA